MKRAAWFVVFSCTALCFVTNSLHADTIFSENFDSLPLGFTQTAGQFHTLGVANVLVTNDVIFVTPPESGNAVDMGFAVALQSVPITLGPGSYFLSFDLVGAQGGGGITSTDVSLGPTGGPILYYQNFLLTAQDDSSGIVSNAVINVSGSQETVFLTFFVNVGVTPQYGPLLDNVSITTATATAPEPSSLLLLGTGALGIFGIRRKLLPHWK